MVSFAVPHPALLPFIGFEAIPDPLDEVDVCALLKGIHIKALSKIACIQVEDCDYYKLDDTETRKPQVLAMLERLVEWTAIMYQRSCLGPSIQSAKPNVC